MQPPVHLQCGNFFFFHITVHHVRRIIGGWTTLQMYLHFLCAYLLFCFYCKKVPTPFYFWLAFPFFFWKSCSPLVFLIGFSIFIFKKLLPPLISDWPFHFYFEKVAPINIEIRWNFKIFVFCAPTGKSQSN